MQEKRKTGTLESFDAIIIGSGLAGLTTAASLAAAGQRVVVLEQYSVVGGSTHVFRRKGKWEWQVGVHHLADCGFSGDMPTILRGLGIGRDQLQFRRMDDNAFERIIFPDLTFDTPNDWGLYEARLIDAFPDERKRIQRFLSAARHVGAAVDRGPTLSTVGGFARAVVNMGPFAPLAALPLKTVFELFGLSSRLQTLLSVSPCGSLNSPPSRLPFAAFGAYYRLFIEGGSWYPVGGGQMLASTLLQTIEHFGGKVITGVDVDSIMVTDGTARGVSTTAGNRYFAPVVVSTADIKKTFHDLLPAGSVPQTTLDKVSKYRMSHAFFNAFLGVDVDLTEHSPNRDHFTMPTWTTLDDINATSRYRQGDTPESYFDRVAPLIPAYVHCSNLKDPGNPRYAPPGSSSLEVMFPLECDYRVWGSEASSSRDHSYTTNETYQFTKQSLTDLMIERATTAFPAVEGHVVHREAATPITQERYTRSTLGSAYGIEMNTRQLGVLRPGPTTSVRGLFLAGASCRPGPTTEGVLLSGIYTASAILGRDLKREFAQGRYLVGPGVLPSINAFEWDPLDNARGRTLKATPEPTSA